MNTSTDTNTPEPPARHRARPGKVRDLWEAASLSTDLQSMLTTYDAATTRADQLSQIDALLLSWADTAGMQTLEERGEVANEETFERVQVA